MENKKLEILKTLQNGENLENQDKILKSLVDKISPKVDVNMPVKFDKDRVKEPVEEPEEPPFDLDEPLDLLSGVRDDLQNIVITIREEISKLENTIDIPEQDNSDIVSSLSEIKEKIKISKQDNKDIITALKKIESKINDSKYPEMIANVIFAQIKREQ